jgi:hypothetical protein
MGRGRSPAATRSCAGRLRRRGAARIVVAGPAGMGKTRLAREALAAPAGRRANVVWAHGSTAARPFPLGDVRPGGLVVFPAGAASTFEVLGESARFLAITSGNGGGRFFADFADSVPADRPVQESMAAILSVTSRHGVALAGG